MATEKSPKKKKQKSELVEISKLLRCSYEQAAELCNRIRSLCTGYLPSNKCIAEVLEQLEAQRERYTIEDAAQLATRLHNSQVRRKLRAGQRSKFSEGPTAPQKLPRYVVHPDGTVTSSKVMKDEKYLD